MEKREGSGFRGLLPVAPANGRRLSLFPCAGLGRLGQGLGFPVGEQREMEKGAGVGVLGSGKLRK